jgi:drug/metabolite transporter (DMT)-like permease
LLCGIWGSTWLFIKLGLRDLPPLTFAGLRFLVACALLLVLAAIRRASWPRSAREWLLVVATGILAFALNYGLLFWGEHRISSGLTAVLQTTIPIFGLFLAHAHVPGERITWQKLGGVLLGALGVATLFSEELRTSGSDALAGSVAIVVGAFCVAYSNVLVKAYAERIDPIALAAGQMLVGFVPLVAVGWSVEGSPFALHWTGLAIVSFLYLVLVGSCAAFLLFYWLVRHMEVTRIMLISLVTPFLAVALGGLVLGERLSWRLAAGGVAIVLGIALNVGRRGPSTREAPRTFGPSP